MHFLVCSDVVPCAKLETNALPFMRNKGKLGLAEEGLKVGFGHLIGFHTFPAQHSLSMGFKIYLLSIRNKFKIYFNICNDSFEIGSRTLRVKIKILGNFKALEI